ncbi:major facilitator superfamily domain-containing protein [Nemania sp. FL0031]|nr:major facilitator superfamily domain-containing protein [Nemania sp. FL0031]
MEVNTSQSSQTDITSQRLEKSPTALELTSKENTSRDTHHDIEKTPTDHGLAAPNDGGGGIEQSRVSTQGDLENTRSIDRAAEAEIESQKYPSTWRATLLTLGLCLVTFATSVDNTIIATAIPSITEEFHSLDDVAWYASSYLLASTALQPSFGKVYTHFDVKWVYLGALLVFEVGSIVAATSKSSIALIIGRVVAGLGGGGLTSGGSTIIALMVPIEKRAVFNSTFASTFGIASVVGPLLGGVCECNSGLFSSCLSDFKSRDFPFWRKLCLEASKILAADIQDSNN